MKSKYLWHCNILTSCVSSHWLWMERRGCLLLAVFSLPLKFFCHVHHHWLRLEFHLARPLPCHSLVHWFALPYLALHKLITVYLSYWAAPSHSLIFELMIEHFLVPSTSHVSLHHLFLKKIYSLFWLYTDNLLNKIIS